MKVFLQCTTKAFETYGKMYLEIRDFLIFQNWIITKDWLPSAYNDFKNNKKQYSDRRDYKDYLRAIKEADVVIVENTISSFSTGHTITLCAQRKKPCLVLSQTKENKHFEESFFDLIETNYLERHYYKNEEFKRIIQRFIKKFFEGTKMHRFNMYIDEVERKYLDWATYKKKQSRSELIRKALREYIKQDKNYESYLAK